MAFRSFHDAGIHAAAGSDFSPGPFAPMMGMQGMVTRKGWNGETWGANQRISVDEALRVLTINGAYASHEEAIKGSISPGKPRRLSRAPDAITTCAARWVSPSASTSNPLSRCRVAL